MFNKVSNFLANHTVWMFFTSIQFVSVVLVSGGAERTWGAYLYYMVWLCVVSSPVLLFSSFRKRIHYGLQQNLVVFLWSFCFILYPILLCLLKPESFLRVENVNLHSWTLIILFIVFFITELLIQWNDAFIRITTRLAFLGKLSLEKAIWIGMTLGAFGLMAIDMYYAADNTSFNILRYFYFSIQLLVIFFVYYSFYWLNHYLLFTRLFKEKGFIFYAFGFAFTLFLLFPIAAQIIYFLPMVHEYKMHPVATEDIFSGIQFLIPFAGMLLSTPILIVSQWIRQNNDIATLEKEKTNTELRLLKQQINPHFFFNTLNNLYALSLTKDEQTPEVVLQLSELMRYVIKRGKEEEVPLKEEVKYIEDYINLQKIRLHQKMDFTFIKEMENENVLVPPLLFINLVENAFKHGIEPAGSTATLEVELSANTETLEFICRNSFDDPSESDGGLGLKNLKRRLELTYPKRHKIETLVENNMYTVNLNIQL